VARSFVFPSYSEVEIKREYQLIASPGGVATTWLFDDLEAEGAQDFVGMAVGLGG
jgi:hypothetical protein